MLIAIFFFPQFLKIIPQLFFSGVIAGIVEFLTHNLVGKEFHIHKVILKTMSILVFFSVTKVFHEFDQ